MTTRTCSKCHGMLSRKELEYLTAPSGTPVDENGQIPPGYVQETGMVVPVLWCEPCKHVESVVGQPYIKGAA